MRLGTVLLLIRGVMWLSQATRRCITHDTTNVLSCPSLGTTLDKRRSSCDAVHCPYTTINRSRYNINALAYSNT
uniref:Putative secreted protein n=1 Tax=Anopheles triannulatus TaxID=58253 RepID=A0A2M4B3Q2_9DIPT